VCEALDQLAAHWPRSAGLLASEHAELLALFAELLRALGAPGAPPLAAGLYSRLEEVNGRRAPETGELAERTRALRALQAELIRALAAAPPSPAREALRAQLRRALRATLDRAAER